MNILKKTQPICIFIALLTMSFTFTVSASANEKEQKMKAAYIYKFMKLTEFSNTPSNDMWIFCSAGQSNYFKAFSTYRKRQINGLPIGYKRLRQPEDLKGCSVIYVESNAKGDFQNAVNKLKGQPVLTISDGNLSGTMINFFRKGLKQKFSIEQSVAQSSGLVFSKKIISTASENTL